MYLRYREPVQEHERASGSDRHGPKERAGQDPGRGRLQRGGAGRVPAPELP